ncbi:MAG TPA: pilus (MSHA type) biogenesis protein MshL [Methylophilaceae bacterium]|jgi:general secretion pathway protein D
MMTMKNFWLFLSIVALTGCAHQTPIPPSQGHLGSEPEAQVAAPSADIPKPVKKITYVPPPKPKVKEQTYSVVVSSVPVQEVLFALARESKLNVDIDPTIQGKVTLNAVDQTLPAILDRLSKQLDLRYKVEGNVISIAPDFPVLRTYKIDYVNLERDTTTSLGAGSEVSSGGSSSSSSGSESTVSIKSKAEAHFWELLTNNIRNILSSTKSQAASNVEKAAEVDAAKQQQEDRLKQIDAVSKAGPGAEKLYQEAFKTPAAAAIPVTIGKDEVIVNPVAGAITVMATERQHAFIQQYIDGVMASVQRQVLIEATIVEVTLNNQFQQGIDWSRLASDGSHNGFTFSQALGGTAIGLAGPAADTTNQFVLGFSKSTSIGNLAASIRLLNAFGDTRVLSSPKIMALNNQAALLKVVDNIVYFKVDVTPATISSSGSVSSPATYTTTPQVVPVGVVMSVTPQINSNGNVSLNVRPTISRIIKFVNDPNPALVGVANQVPQIQVREMETLLQVNTGQTVILGGLMQDELDNTDNSVPGFANLPLVGKAFKSNNDIRTKTELVIFLRPTIITSPNLDSTELKSFKQYLPNNQFPVAADEPAN